MKSDISQATVIYLFLTKFGNSMLVTKLLRGWREGGGRGERGEEGGSSGETLDRGQGRMPPPALTQNPHLFPRGETRLTHRDANGRGAGLATDQVGYC